MSVETAIVEMITNSGAVSALIGDNIWPNIIPEGESFPGIAYSLITGDDTRPTNDGQTGLTIARVQLTVQNEKGTTGYSDLLEIRDAIITLCRGVSRDTYDSLVIDHIESISLDLPNLEPETTIYGKVIDMTVYILD